MKARLDRRYNLLENFILLASPNKVNVQKGLNNFLELSREDGTVNFCFKLYLFKNFLDRHRK